MPKFADPNITTNITQTLTYVNDVSDGWGWSIILFGIFFIILISQKNYSFTRSFASTSSITFILALMLRILNLISDYSLLICFVSLIGSVGFLIIEKRGEYG